MPAERAHATVREPGATRRPRGTIAVSLGGLLLALAPFHESAAAAPSTRSTPAPAPDPAGPQRGGKSARPELEPFIGRLAGALALARERNVPVAIVVILEGEPENDKTRDGFLPDPVFANAAQWTVPMVTNNGVHSRVEVEERREDGTTVKKEVCSKYGTRTCADHQGTWDEVYNAYTGAEGEMACPQVLVVLPDGTLFERVTPGDVPKPRDVAASIERARKQVGAGILASQVPALRELHARAQRAQKDRDFAAAYSAWSGLFALLPDGERGAEARAGLATCGAAVAAERDQALELVAAGEIVRGWEQLVGLRDGTAGTDLERDLAERVRALERAPETKDEIEAHKQELAAGLLLREIEALVAEGGERKAARQIRILLRKYPDTEAGRSAAARWPEHAPGG